VFGPIDAMIRACGLALARTMTQFRETDVTHCDFCRFFAAVDAGVLAGDFVPAFADVSARGGFVVARGDTRLGVFFAARFGDRSTTRVGVRSADRTAGGAASRTGWRPASRVSRTGAVAGSGSGSRPRAGGAVTGKGPGSRAGVLSTGGRGSRVATAAAGEPGTESAGASLVTARVVSGETTPVGVGVRLSTLTVPALATIVGLAAESAAAEESGLRSAFILAAETSAGGSSWTSHAPHAIATNARTPTPFQTYGPIAARSGCVPHQRQTPSFAG
jgi:hypothetical protein